MSANARRWGVEESALENAADLVEVRRVLDNILKSKREESEDVEGGRDRKQEKGEFALVG